MTARILSVVASRRACRSCGARLLIAVIDTRPVAQLVACPTCDASPPEAA